MENGGSGPQLGNGVEDNDHDETMREHGDSPRRRQKPNYAISLHLCRCLSLMTRVVIATKAGKPMQPMQLETSVEV